jgi:valyl-tRNA synthetase
MPFLTEELWARLGDYGAKRDGLLINAAWPKTRSDLSDPASEEEIGWIIDLVSAVRATRAALNVPPSARIPLLLIGADPAISKRLEDRQELIDRLARLEYSTTADEAPKGSVTFVLRGATAALPLEGIVDFAAEAERLKKEVAKLEGEIKKTEAKLSNADFVARAPEEVVEENRERLEEAKSARTKLADSLAQLEQALAAGRD